jgi:hypothetical protein
MDGAVLCARCGLEQAFDVSRFEDALALAHHAGEVFREGILGGSAPGLDDGISRLGRLGITKIGTTWIKETFEGDNRLEVTASPGSPRCEACHGALEVTLGGGGSATVTCPRCATSAVYGTPDAALRMNGGTLRAALAIEHRTDRDPVKTEASPGAGAIAIQCPSCRAPLPATQQTRFATCSYCNTVSRIPDRTWFQLGGKDPVRERMWLHFAGHSRFYLEAEREIARLAAARRESEARAAAARAEAEAQEVRKQSAKQSTVSYGLGRTLARARVPLLVVAVLAVATVGAAVWASCRSQAQPAPRRPVPRAPAVRAAHAAPGSRPTESRVEAS